MAQPQFYFQLQIKRQWQNKGIMVIGDSLDVFHNILPLESINETYNINMKLLEHHKLKLKLKDFFKPQNCSLEALQLIYC